MHWRGGDPEDSVFLSQRDVRELQFAKASIATGWQILLRELGIEPGDISQVLLAGSLRRVPVAGQRGPHRPRAAAGPAAHRLGRQRRRRGGEDGGAQPPRARRGALDRPRGRVRRALRPRRTSTTCSSTSWRSRDEPRRGRRLRGARRRRAARSRGGAGWDVDVAPAPRAAAQPAGADRGRGRGRAGAARRRATTGSPSRTPTAAPTARSTPCSSGRAPRLRGEHCYDVLDRAEVREALAEEPGTYLLTDFLARTFEHTVAARARPRPPSRAARRLLRPLHARAVARAAPDARDARGRRARRPAPRAAARGARGRRRGRRARLVGAARVRGLTRGGYTRGTWGREAACLHFLGRAGGHQLRLRAEPPSRSRRSPRAACGARAPRAPPAATTSSSTSRAPTAPRRARRSRTPAARSCARTGPSAWPPSRPAPATSPRRPRSRRPSRASPATPPSGARRPIAASATSPI